jgi:hypothetical protein
MTTKLPIPMPIRMAVLNLSLQTTSPKLTGEVRGAAERTGRQAR